VTVTAVAACGSSSSSSGASKSAASAAGTSTSGGSASAAFQAAAAAAKGFEQIPTKFQITTPIAKPIPTGKKIVFIYCGTPGCNTFGAAIHKESQLLGWSYSELTTTGTPASVKSAWDTAVRMHPDIVMGSGFNLSVFASEAKQLKAQGAFVGNWGTTDPEPPSSGVTLQRGSSSSIALVGKQLAAFVVDDTHGKANTLYVGVPSYAALVPVGQLFESSYKKWCPGCGLSTLNLPLTALGTTSVPMIVSYLRAHPSINYVALGIDAADIGLPAALKAAGLHVPFAGAYATATNLGYIKSGDERATIDIGYWESMAVMVDAAARFAAHQSLAPDEKADFRYWIVTKNNLTPNAGGAGPAVPNLSAELKQLWK
jgi:ribose transport system substrate-binding protein